MLFLQKIRLFFASRSTILFFKMFFISLPITLAGVYFIFYSDYGIRYFDRMRKARPLIDSILYDPIAHDTNAVYPPESFRNLKDVNVYQKPEVLWEGTALDPLYELPKQGKPATPRGN